MPLPEPKRAWEREEEDSGYGPDHIAKVHAAAFRSMQLVDVLIRTIVP